MVEKLIGEVYFVIDKVVKVRVLYKNIGVCRKFCLVRRKKVVEIYYGWYVFDIVVVIIEVVIMVV